MYGIFQRKKLFFPAKLGTYGITYTNG